LRNNLRFSGKGEVKKKKGKGKSKKAKVKSGLRDGRDKGNFKCLFNAYFPYF